MGTISQYSILKIQVIIVHSDFIATTKYKDTARQRHIIEQTKALEEDNIYLYDTIVAYYVADWKIAQNT